MSVTRQHNNALNVISTNLIINNFSINNVLIAKLNQSMTTYYYKLLPLCMMPMLTFSYTWFRDVNTNLTTI